jgi:hypothetical protein
LHWIADRPSRPIANLALEKGIYVDIKPFNEILKNLKTIVKTESKFKDLINQSLYLHSLVHVSKMSDLKEQTYEDDLWDGLSDEIAKSATNKKGRTVVYGIWHSTRIEDITANLLIDGSKQILDASWMKKINSSISNTGNQLSSEEILSFSKAINIDELKEYRLEVGRKTRKIIKELKFSELRRKFPEENSEKIFQEKAVAKHPDAEWLVDFWENKDVAGIIFMPMTRHHMVHINESNQAKARGRKKK